MKTICGLFANRDDAQATIEDLERRGFERGAISLVARRPESDLAPHSMADDPAETGAGIGAIAGAAGGLLASLGFLTIPGIGPVLAGGWLMTTLAASAAGAIIGGATGSLIDTLRQHGVEAEDADLFAEGIRRGAILLSVQVEDDKIVAAEAAFLRHRVDIAALRDTYIAEGWTRFDDHVNEN